MEYSWSPCRQRNFSPDELTRPRAPPAASLPVVPAHATRLRRRRPALHALPLQTTLRLAHHATLRHRPHPCAPRPRDRSATDPARSSPAPARARVLRKGAGGAVDSTKTDARGGLRQPGVCPDDAASRGNGLSILTPTADSCRADCRDAGAGPWCADHAPFRPSAVRTPCGCVSLNHLSAVRTPCGCVSLNHLSARSARCAKFRVPARPRTSSS